MRDSALLLMALAVFLWPSFLTFWDNVVSGSALGILRAAASASCLAIALWLGWIAAKGWPQWFVRLIRRRNATSKPVAIQ